MAKKERKATEILNVEMAAVDSAITVALSLIADPMHPASKVLTAAQERAEAARDALLTIQFHAAQI